MLIVNADRAQLLTHLPQGGVVAEVGVFRGAFATEILKKSRPEKLHLIDPWAHDGNPTDQHVVAMQASHDRVQRLFADDTKTGRVEIHRDYSTSAALTFPDHYFDWVYIDAEHDYTSVKTDLEAFRDKVKPDGVILGHDFSRRHDRAYFGVITAVREFAIEHAFEILLITNESSPTYLLMRADNEIGMAKLRDDILVSHASLPIEVDVSMFDAFTQVEVPVAKGKLAQMLSFGACLGNIELAHGENPAAHADHQGRQDQG